MNLSKQARQRIAKTIQNGAVLLHGNKTIYRNNDANYQFRQFSDFHYLTEWPEPDAHAVILINDSIPELHMFVLDKNEEMETWDGKRIGQQDAVELYGAKRAYSNIEYSNELINLLKGHTDIYCDYSSSVFQEIDQQALNLAAPYDQRGGNFSHANLYSIQPILSESRLIKEDGELELLKKACDISIEGHLAAMKFTKPGIYEYQVAAEMEKTFYHLGAERLGYNSIVAGGENACILHYATNREELLEGQLLLIDAAAEYGMYSADITRTFPINGKYSTEQKAVYSEVLKAQDLGIEMVTPQNTMQEVHKATIASISESLVNLGLVPQSIEDTISMMHYFQFFMHGTGHWLGLDVHDAGSNELNSKPRKFSSGMVTTIEPGIYVRPSKPVIKFPLLERDPEKIKARRKEMGMEAATKLEQKEMQEAKTVEHEIPEGLLGIGVRIEDNILCTQSDPVNLTKALPRDIDEIENICS
jgi:Xaa-Pro aminopeptidase